MATLRFILRKLLYSLPLLLGVTLISFILMVYFGPDQTYSLIGKNPSQEDLSNIRQKLGYNLPFYQRYFQYLKEVFTFDFGHSSSSNEQVRHIFARALPVSLAVALPGFIIGNLSSIFLAMIASYYRGKWQDKLIMLMSVTGMSISLLIVVISFQLIFSTSYGLNLFPVQGWEVNNIFDYFKYVTVPSLSLIFVSIGYNTRFFRAVLVEEFDRDHVRTAKAFGCQPFQLVCKYVLKNSLVPILTRIIFTIPFVFIGGSLLIESFFSIPGMGSITYDAITSGDLPVIKAVVSMTTLVYMGVLIFIEILYKAIDPRIGFN